MTKGLTVRVAGHVRAPPERVWSVLGDFGNEHRWTSLLAHSARDTPGVEVGTVRTCTLAKPVMGRDIVQEEVVHVEPGRALKYRVRGGVGPFMTLENAWTLRPDGVGTRVEAQATFVPRNALVLVAALLARAHLRRVAEQGVREFTAYVERAHVEAEA